MVTLLLINLIRADIPISQFIGISLVLEVILITYTSLVTSLFMYFYIKNDDMLGNQEKL